MATKNRRVAAYLPLEVDKAFIEFKIERGLATEESPNRSDSQALIQLMSEFLGVGHSVAYSSESDVLERLSRLEDEVAHLRAQVNDVAAARVDVKGELLSELRSELVNATPGQLSILDEPSHMVDEPNQPLKLPDKLLKGLSARALERRWPVSRRTIGAHKETSREEFLQWSAEQDPEGIGWEYRGTRYYPVIDLNQ